MRLHRSIFLLSLAALPSLLAACVAVQNPPRTPQPAAQRTLILTAFGDAQATYGETRPFLQALQNKADRTAESAFCEGVYEGEISGQPVVVVTTGTGGDNSGPCMQELLYLYRGQVKEAIWSGIGGATPAVGGLVDDTGRRRPDAEPVMIGDVCISALTWNYDLHFSSVSDWAAAAQDDGRYNPAGGWWSMQTFTGTTTVPGFENVRQFVTTTTTLADELLGAAQQVTWPSMNSGVQEKVERYFPGEPVRAVRVFDYTQCGEVGGDNFWHGVVEDKLSRQYLAGLIAAAGYAGEAAVSEDTVVVFSAMEAQAWMSVLARWNEHYGVNIPMAVIRAASNYDHPPLDADGNPLPGPDGQPMTAMDDIEAGFQEAGGDYAAGNAAAPVLKLLEGRGGTP